jgi:hypothetical protein
LVTSPCPYAVIGKCAVSNFGAERPSLGGRWRGEAVTDEGYAVLAKAWIPNLHFLEKYFEKISTSYFTNAKRCVIIGS